MRVTANSFPDSLVNQLNTLAGRQNRLQSQAASGQRITTADDDPAAMQRVLDLQSEGSSVAQFQKNIAKLQETSTASYDVMRALKKNSDRLGELATLADGTKSPEALHAYGDEVEGILKQTAQLMNTKHGGDYLFGGTRTDQPPFVSTTDTDGNITSVTYQGNTDVPDIEIAEGSLISAQIPGENSTGSGARGLLADSRTGADLFAHMISFQKHLLAGDTASIASTDRPALAKDEDNLIYQIGTTGALQSRLDAASSIASSRSDSITSLVSKEADADIATTLVKLNQTQTAYQAALQSGASIMRTSLLDYLG